MAVKESIIILTWNGLKYIFDCLSSVRCQINDQCEVLVIDNGSFDGTPSFVREYFPSVRVIENTTNLGVSAGWNIGINLSRGKLIYFINQDVYLLDNWLIQMRKAMLSNKQIGVLGCKLLYPSGKIIQHAGGQVTPPQFLTTHYGQGLIDNGLYDSEAEVDYVTGAAMCIKSLAT